MLTLAQKQRGFSLIELIIGVAIIGILLSVGLPAFSLWVENTKTRTAAEAILNGLQLARTEAVRRNVGVRFNLTGTTASGSTDWTVGCVTAVGDMNFDGVDDCPAIIQSRSGSEGTNNARAGISTAVPMSAFTTVLTSGTDLPAGVTFSGLGRVASAAGVDISRIDITNVDAANNIRPNTRRMVITVGSGGTIRMCDPGVPLATSPQGCI